MKKSSLMGASVVAAALLAAAPIAAPVANIASGTQVVKAAVDTNTAEVAQKVKTMGTSTTVSGNITSTATKGSFHHFYNQLGWIDQLKDLRNNLTEFNTSSSSSPSNPLQLSNQNITVAAGGASDFLSYFFAGNQQVSLGTPQNETAARHMYYTMQFDYSNAINTLAFPIRTTEDAYRARTDMSINGGTVTMSVQLYDGAKNSLGDAGLLKSTVSYKTNNQRAAYVNYNSTLSAKVGDSANIYGLSNSFMNANGNIKNYNGDDITMAAYNAGAISATPLRSTNYHPGNTGIIDGNFAKTGTYYQQVIVNLPNAGFNAGANPEDWANAAANGLITVNGQAPSTTNADADVYLVTGANHSTVVDGSASALTPGTLVLKRTVNVTADNGTYKDEKVSGVVTVNGGSDTTAPLYDEDGNVKVSRNLAGGSRWKTDVRRTMNKNGKAFYRLSSHEYIAADKVSFEEASAAAATTPSSNNGAVITGKVEVTDIPLNVIRPNGSAGMLSTLWKIDGNSMVLKPSRNLAAGSPWAVNKKAVVNGVTFYAVSGNEWMKADDGHLEK
ncbi:SLAP domain-containing protein [Bombilactobacillus bombi]|uniref:SLAP domain-containing protein n=1 Tax=Bombilactobacillus bombi TaxID=1303590 RepID=UPI0015E5A86F|nr:SLAP domain-containing protein [Bombilactobacillus bombi]MBA1434286.1 hypothetical protein [Bombilactobacillus bombi]